MKANVLRVAALLGLVVSHACVCPMRRGEGRLIARDGTTCVVSKKKFHSTQVGMNVWCTWTDPAR